MNIQLNLNTKAILSAAQFDMFEQEAGTGLRNVSVEEFSNSTDAARYIEHASKPCIGNVFNQISVDPFVYGKDWESFPIVVGNTTYHFVTTENREHDFLTKIRGKKEIVMCNGVAVLSVEKNAAPGTYYAYRYLNLASVEKAIARVQAENTIVAHYAHRHCMTDLFDTYDFNDVFDIVEGKGDVCIRPDTIRPISVNTEFRKYIDSYRLSQMDYTLELCHNPEQGENGRTYLYCSYQQIIGGFYVAFIDPATLPLKLTPFKPEKCEQKDVAEPVSSDVSVDNTFESELKLLTVSEKRIDLPKTQLTHYQNIRTKLTKAGGKYKNNGFDFSEGNAVEVFETVLAGKVVKSKKQEYAFFATGRTAAEKAVNRVDIQPGKRIFEPHAGHGNIADLVRDKGIEPIVNELWDTNAQVLRDKGYNPHTQDFLQMSPEDIGGLVDAVVGNPPWGGKLVDIDHFMHCLTFLKEGGEICMLISNSAIMQSTKKAKEFQNFLASCGAYTEELLSGMFEGTAASGTLVHITNWQSNNLI